MSLFLIGLRHADPSERAAALTHLPVSDLQDPDVLRAFLRLMADTSPLPQPYQPTVETDPFAGFFEPTAPPKTLRFTDLCLSQVDSLALVGDGPQLEVLTDALRLDSEEVATGVCKLFASAQWPQPDVALQTLIPPLLRADRSLLPLLPSLSIADILLIAKLALRPLSLRAVNELLNHPSAKDAAARAIVQQVQADPTSLSQNDALRLLPLMTAWGATDANASAALAISLEAAYPWASGFAALDNADAAQRFSDWLNQVPPAPAIAQSLTRALANRAPSVHFPLIAFLKWSDGSAQLLHRWDLIHPATPWLIERVRNGHAHWIEALSLLLQANAHAPLIELIETRLTALPFERDLLSHLASAQPPIPDVFEHITRWSLSNLDQLHLIEPALSAFSIEQLAPWLDTLITQIEAIPAQEQTRGRGLRKRFRPGVDLNALKSAVERCAHPALTERWLSLKPQRI